MSTSKNLPINIVVDMLENNISNIPSGKPSFADDRYSPFDLNVDYFHPLPKLRSERKIAFVDGGSSELMSAPNFAIGLSAIVFLHF